MTLDIDYVICDGDHNVVETIYKLPDGGMPLLLVGLHREQRKRERQQRRLERLAARNLRREFSYVKRKQAAAVRMMERRQR